MQVQANATVPLSLQLWNGDATRFARAYLFNADGSAFTTPFVNLTNVGNGLFIDNSQVMTGTKLYATYRVFTDNTYATLDTNHTIAEDHFEVITVTVSGGGGSMGAVAAKAFNPPVFAANFIEKIVAKAQAQNEQDVEARAFSPAVVVAQSNQPNVVKAVALSELETP